MNPTGPTPNSTPPSREVPTQRDDPFGDAPDPGFFAEFWDFLRTSKKWWMLPLLLVFLMLGALLLLAQTAAAPFIYTLF